MAQEKKTVNLKKFLADFRSGKSDADLMSRHGLDKRGLHKLLRVLEERQLLDSSSLNRSRSDFGPAEEDKRPVDNSTASSGQDDRAVPEPLREPEPPDSKCPQCGADVSEKMLTCPECGHVLPGERRWERVKPETSFLKRVPPWVVGCVVALPIATAMYMVFKHVLVPLSSASIQNRAKALQKTGAAKKNTGQQEKETVPPIEAEIRRCTRERTLLAVSSDYTAYTVTDRWHQLARADKVTFLRQIGVAMSASGLKDPFQVKDDTGGLCAIVSSDSIELVDRYGFRETIDRQDQSAAQEAPEGDRKLPAQ